MSALRPALAAALLMLTAAQALAANADTATIGGDAFKESQGRIGVNVAAGTLNQQANVAVTAIGGLAVGTNKVVQSLESNTVSGTGPQNAAIEGNAFSDSFGMIAVNDVAGVQNQQANLAAIAIGIDSPALSLDMLEQTRSSPVPDADPLAPPVDKSATLGPTAFDGAGGLVQINVTAGERNSVANLFALSVAGGSNN